MSLLADHALDILALAWFAVTVSVLPLVARSPDLAARSISAAVQAQRVAWMRNMAARDVRLVDAQILQTLSHGNAFFASTSAIAIGGVAALVGSGDTAHTLIERIPFVAPSTPLLFEMKLGLLAAIFIYAFFKYAWAFRLSHYTGIMIGATPIPGDGDAAACEIHAQRTAALIGVAAEHSTKGLRAFHHAISALAWFFHPILFMLAATAVLAVLVRREYFSRAARIVSGRWP